jgi:TonB family protein
MQRATYLGCTVAALLCSLALGAPTAAAHACDAIGVPAIPNFTPATVSKRADLRYPKGAENELSEGWVLLEFAITAQGVPRDVSAADAFGPKVFVTNAIESISNWRYHPATRKGVPVEQSLNQVSVLFLFHSNRRAEHQEFVTKHNVALHQLKNNRPDEAIATLESAFQGRTNLYEAAVGSFALAIAYTRKQDWVRALFHIRHAVLDDGQYLEQQMRPPARQLQVELEGRNGNLVEALCAFEALQRIDRAAARNEGPAAQNAAALRRALEDPAPLVVPVRLTVHPLIDGPGVSRHRLLRPKFLFADIQGDVKSFKLACHGTTHTAAVEADMQWNVPSDAGACILRVDGAPGASFKLVQEW